MTNYPKHIFSGVYKGCGHCQGIATDGRYMYFSFTTMLVKTDLNGNFIGSATGLTGHLGCIAYDSISGKVVGSLEYKRDGIGMGILKSLGVSDTSREDSFYLVRFDVEKITERDMDAVNDGIMTGIRLTDVCEDYAYKTEEVTHRYACSGIDGVTLIPDFEGRRTYFVAYGIYGDTERSDNDCQVLLAFDHEELDKRFLPLFNGNESTARGTKYFVYTGNTEYGIQNLEYDPTAECLMAAVYPGKKKHFPNYPMYFIDFKRHYADGGVNYMPLCERGTKHKESGVWGLDIRHQLGDTGMIALGDGMYYFAHTHGETDNHYTDVFLYKKDGEGFVKSD